MKTRYVIGRPTWDSHGFRDGELYYGGVRTGAWSKKLILAFIFDDESLAVSTLGWLESSSGLSHKDSEIWKIDSKKLFEARLKG